MAENIADTTVENENVNWEERAKKAEAKIVDMKKQDEEKATPQETTPAENKQSYTKEDLEDAVKKAVKEYHIQAKEEEYTNNINETNSASIGGEDASVSDTFSAVSADEYMKMTDKEKDSYREKCLENLGELTVL